MAGAVVALASSVVAIFVGAALYGDPDGDRPSVRTEIAVRSAPPPAATAPDPPASPGQGGARRDAGTVESESGVSVVRPPGSAAPGSVVVRAPGPGSAELARAPDERLVERTRHGLIPRIGPDGARSVDVYARPAEAGSVGRIALVVGGLGISRAMTAEAIAKLPPAVSLAFAPYGPDLDRAAGSARSAGHEILLQVPMEPFDFPDSDPGPHTLLAAATPAENVEHLHWAMGRVTGYVALMNYMGAKLTADDKAVSPILREAGQRGLGFLDDGSSARSRVTALAGETRAGRADIVIDAVPRADLIDKALDRLEAIARSGRIAVGSASSLPVTIERIVRWSEGLEARGGLLVPASAALRGPDRAAERRP